jgi:hypothetical protein
MRKASAKAEASPAPIWLECHGWPGLTGHTAPCGVDLTPETTHTPGRGFSAAERFIKCADCLRLGRAGAFELIREPRPKSKRTPPPPPAAG